MTIDDALQLRLLAVIIRVGLEDDRFIGLPAKDLVGAGTGITGLQEFITEIRVVFVIGARGNGLRLFGDELLVDHRSDSCGEHVQHEARRIGLVDRQYEGVRIRSLGFSLTLSPLRPNCVSRNAGDLSSLTARSKENATSSAVIGLPEANFRPDFSLKV